MIKKLLLILLLLLVFGCKAAIQEEILEVIEEMEEEVVEEPEVVEEVIEEPEVEEVIEVVIEESETVSIDGTWEGTFIETQIASICTLENTGTITLTFTMADDTFTGTIVEKGRSKLISGDSDCAGSYTTVGTTSGKVEGTDKITATISVKSSKIDADIPFTATIENGVMTAKYAGEGVEEGYDFVIEEGSFSVTRTS